MKEFFCDIANSTTTVGEGTRATPYNWGQYLTVLSGATQKDDLNIYIKGLRSINGNGKIDINDNDGTHIFKLMNWESTPWEISGSGIIEVSTGNINSNETYKTPKELYFVGGIIICDGDLEFEEVDSAEDRIIEFNNCWIKEF